MLSQEISQFCTRLQFADLSPAVVASAKTAIMDWLGSVLAGSTRPPAGMIAGVVRDGGGKPQATMIGFNEKTSVLGAALVNGASCHILELDDLHRSSILHPAAPVISAAAAAAELEKASGRDLITAVVAGYEVAIRIAEAVTPSHYYYWHTTATCGTFGAAVAAAKICGLTEEEIVNALGNAGSQAAGLWEFLQDGAMTKHLHPGKAAMNGTLAVLLARRGFTGAKRILEGDKGFFRATAAQFDPERVTAGLREEYRILGNSYKIYPSCRHTHSAVDLALKLVQEGIKAGQIENIVIKTYGHARDLTGNANPVTPYEARFSLPFGVAAALVDGKLDLESFEFSGEPGPALREIMERCTVVSDAEMESLYPARWPAVVRVILKDGRVIEKRTDSPRGDPENPATAAELKEKFAGLARMRWTRKDVEQSLEMLENLEDLERAGVLFAGGNI